MEENTNLPEWVQSKVTLAEDYISTAANYLRGELTEAAKWRSTSIAKKVTDPDDESSRSYDYHHENPRSTGMKQATSDKPYSSGSLMTRPKAQGASQGARKGIVTKQHAASLKDRIKSAMRKEEVELSEGRPSQRHPLEGHEYHKKTNAELEYIAKDAHKAAEAMKSHNTTAENKYRDQANDSATVRYFRQKSGMPDWYKKKYGHVKEETEQLDEKNVPTSPEKWAQAKAQAKSKFDVYPSAYANGWAAKKYKEMGGGWKSVSENTDDPSAAARTLSRKAQIVRDAAKGKKQEQEQASDKFQKDPELSSDIQKT